MFTMIYSYYVIGYHNVISTILFVFSTQGIDKFEGDLTTLHPILAECRIFKSDLELSLIQFANDISSEAHIEVAFYKFPSHNFFG